MHSQLGSMTTAAGAVYVQTNEIGGNRIFEFISNPEGELIAGTEFATGGDGDGMPHLASQGSVTLTGDGNHVLITNAGSGEISDFLRGEGMTSLAQTMPAGGAPKSIAEHDGLVYVLNTDAPSVMGFRLDDDGLEPIAGSTRMLTEDADPAQVGFSPDGRTLMVTERGANAIAAYPVGIDGKLGRQHECPSAGTTPYGFAFTPQGSLVVTEAFGGQTGRAAASSYVNVNGDLVPASRSVGSGHSEVCWAVVSNDGRYVFTTNFGDGSITRYAVEADGSLRLDDSTAATTVTGQKGLRDESLSRDGRFLYAIHSDSQSLYGWQVGTTGKLLPLGSWTGLPTTVAGLAVK